jgi:hypothetical protein
MTLRYVAFECARLRIRLMLPSGPAPTVGTVIPAAELDPETLDPETLGVIYDVVRDQLDKQFDQIESLNSRAQQLVGLGAVIFGLVVGLRPPTDHLSVTVLFLFPLAAFGALVFFGHRAWSIGQWRRDPNPGALWGKHGLGRPATLRYQLVGQWIASHETNRAAIEKKLGRVRLTQFLLGILVVCLVVILLILPYV